MDKFIGPRKVESIQTLELVSFTGGEVYKVTYVGGFTEIISQKTFDLVVTDEPSDYTTVRNKQFEAFDLEFYPLLGGYIASLIEKDEVIAKENRIKFLQNALILVAEYSIKQRDIDVLFEKMAGFITKETFNAIGNSINENYNRVTNFVWTGDDTKFIPGTNPLDEVTFLEAKVFLEKINANQNN